MFVGLRSCGSNAMIFVLGCTAECVILYRQGGITSMVGEARSKRPSQSLLLTTRGPSLLLLLYL